MELVVLVQMETMDLLEWMASLLRKKVVPESTYAVVVVAAALELPRKFGLCALIALQNTSRQKISIEIDMAVAESCHCHIAIFEAYIEVYIKTY